MKKDARIRHRARLEGAGGTDEVAEDGDVGAVDADAAGVNRKAEAFGEVEIHAGIVEFRKAETLRGRNPIESGRIDRTGRPVAAPGAAGNFVELPPVAFLPSGHGDKSLRPSFRFAVLPFKVVVGHGTPPALCGRLESLDAYGSEKVHRRHYPPLPEHGGNFRYGKTRLRAAPRYCKSREERNFPRLMFQTRQGKDSCERLTVW
jgi:hypothetical protein